MKNSGFFLMVALVVTFFGCSLANAQQLRPRPAQLLVESVGSEVIAPVGANEARAQFELEFRATAEGGKICIAKRVSRDNFAILQGNRPARPLVATTNMVLMAEGAYAGDTATHYCVAENQTRIFRFLVVLEYPQQAGYYAIRMKKDLSVIGGRTRFVSCRQDFTTDFVYISNTDAAN